MSKARHLIGSSLMLWGCSIATASAAVFTVNTTDDGVDSNLSDNLCLTAAGNCSLRAAIQQANASAGADVISLPAGVYNLTVEGISEDASASGDLDITSEITINGAGAGLAKIDGMRLDRVMQVHSDGKLTLNAVTVRNGRLSQNSTGGGLENRFGQMTVNDSNITLNHASGMGGGINTFRATTVLNRVTVERNTSDNSGAGIMNQDGFLTINDSTIRDNGGSMFPGTVFGGGIYNAAWSGKLEINNSTISGHDVFLDGGGIYHLLGTLKISNSTLSGNSAGRNGGGLFYSGGNSSFGNVNGELINVTITGNGAEGVDSANPAQRRKGGGIYARGLAPLKLANTLIADNFVGSDCVIDGTVISQGNNLDTDGTCGLASDSSSISGGMALLDLLKDNGGASMTHALLSGSDAIDAGGASNCPATDQRGYARVAASCDIGAFEAGAQAPGNEAAPPPANDGSSTDSTNRVPLAFGLPLAVKAGGSVSAVLNGVDNDGDPLTYQIVQQPTKGSVGMGSSNNGFPAFDIPGSFTYSANADATGSDFFTYRACDALSCSEPATISIAISTVPVTGEMVIEVAPDSGAAPGPVEVVSGNALEATVPDVDYSQPLGVFFFDVNNVPTDANSQLNGTVVTLKLPANAVISANAVIRKLDNTGVWRTLQSAPSQTVTTGTIDATAKTLTLVLRDNDMFDLNPAVGVIRDPVAIAEPKQAADSQPIDGGSAQGSSGGGLFHPLLLLLALFGLRRWR